MSDLIVVNADQIKDMMMRNDAEIQEIIKQNEELLRKYRFLQYGVKVGDVVRCTDGDKQLYKIHSFTQYTKYGKPWVVGNRQKKDGTFGKPTTLIFTNWEVLAGEPNADHQ